MGLRRPVERTNSWLSNFGQLRRNTDRRTTHRAAAHDRDNTFFADDLAELAECGYLRVAVPEPFDGPGLSLAEVGELQRQLAPHAPATAVAVNMHLYWTGVAADLWRAGDASCAWMLEAAAAGEVFAAGHGEAGNDVPLFMSTSTAERVEGGWLISGHKIFGSLSPVWIHLGVHAMVLAGDTVIDPTIVSSLFRRRRQHDPLGDLSTCERDVLALVAEGLPNKAIGERLHIADRTVEAHVTAIFLKLHLDDVPGSHRRVLAVLAFLRAGSSAQASSRNPGHRAGRGPTDWRA